MDRSFHPEPPHPPMTRHLLSHECFQQALDCLRRCEFDLAIQHIDEVIFRTNSMERRMAALWLRNIAERRSKKAVIQMAQVLHSEFWQITSPEDPLPAPKNKAKVLDFPRCKR